MDLDRFDIPVVIIIFKRKKAVDVLNRIAMVKPSKLYILADNGRNESEKAEVAECRRMVEEAITWDCEVIKNYAAENRGVFNNIGLGAKWVFEREEIAIFLEDDNLPEVTFFEYCRQMLNMYENDTRILWICGTNYLGKYNPQDGSSYVFTNHMLPCGWASWSDKFNKFYDVDLKLSVDKVLLSRVEKQYYSKKLYKQYSKCWTKEYEKIISGTKPHSWDYHMDFALKANGLYGISPCNNQIRNIGVDGLATHGGNSFSYRQIRKMCAMESYPLKFPLKHPLSVLPDEIYDKAIYKILLYPIEARFKQSFIINRILVWVRRVLNIPENVTTQQFLKNFLKKNK